MVLASTSIHSGVWSCHLGRLKCIHWPSPRASKHFLLNSKCNRNYEADNRFRRPWRHKPSRRAPVAALLRNLGGEMCSLARWASLSARSIRGYAARLAVFAFVFIVLFSNYIYTVTRDTQRRLDKEFIDLQILKTATGCVYRKLLYIRPDTEIIRIQYHFEK